MALLNTLTKKEFEEKVLKSDKTVLVDFWAAWCPPCVAMAPALSKVAKDMDKTVDIVKVNIEESKDNQMLAGEHQVQSIPNMVVFKGGKEVDRIIGLTQEPALVARLKQA